jgi:pyruvate formate lyase activating enzyme
MDPEIHRHHTGADNILILENLRAVSASGAEMWVRIPVIPGVNDDDANLEATGNFLASLPRPHPVHLLPYHDMAVGKRARLGEAASTAGFGGSEKVTPVAAAGLLSRHGLEVTIGGSS